MFLHKRTLKIMLPIAVVSLVVTIVFSSLQILKSSQVIYAICANIAICIFTSASLVCAQSIVSFYAERKSAVFLFYKETMLLEKKIIDYPYQNSQFVLAEDGLKGLQDILYSYYNSFKWSFFMIDTSSKKNATILAVISLYKLCSIQIAEFKKMEDSIKDAISYLQVSDNEIIAQGKSVVEGTAIHNQKLKEQMDAIVGAFNDKENNRERNLCLDKIEKYLFAKVRK